MGRFEVLGLQSGYWWQDGNLTREVGIPVADSTSTVGANAPPPYDRPAPHGLALWLKVLSKGCSYSQVPIVLRISFMHSAVLGGPAARFGIRADGELSILQLNGRYSRPCKRSK